MHSKGLLMVVAVCIFCLVVGGIITAVIYWGKYTCPSFGSDCPDETSTGSPTVSPSATPIRSPIVSPSAPPIVSPSATPIRSPTVVSPSATPPPLPACKFTLQYKSGTTCSVPCEVQGGVRPAEWVLSPNQSNCDPTQPTAPAGNLTCFERCGTQCPPGTSWGWSGNALIGWACTSDDAGG